MANEAFAGLLRTLFFLFLLGSSSSSTCHHLTPPFAQQRQYLEKVDIPTGVAQAEHVLLLGVLGDRLHDAVLCKEGTSRGTALVRAILTVGLVKQQSTAWERQRQRECRKGMRSK